MPQAKLSLSLQEGLWGVGITLIKSKRSLKKAGHGLQKSNFSQRTRKKTARQSLHFPPANEKHTKLQIRGGYRISVLWDNQLQPRLHRGSCRPWALGIGGKAIKGLKTRSDPLQRAVSLSGSLPPRPAGSRDPESRSHLSFGAIFAQSSKHSERFLIPLASYFLLSSPRSPCNLS